MVWKSGAWILTLQVTSPQALAADVTIEHQGQPLPLTCTHYATYEHLAWMVEPSGNKLLHSGGISSSPSIFSGSISQPAGIITSQKGSVRQVHPSGSALSGRFQIGLCLTQQRFFLPHIPRPEDTCCSAVYNTLFSTVLVTVYFATTLRWTMLYSLNTFTFIISSNHFNILQSLWATWEVLIETSLLSKLLIQIKWKANLT